MTDPDWPVELAGVTESLVATLGPEEAWNLAPLGLFAPGARDSPPSVTARTWGRTRTRRNFEARGGGTVQFATDPLLFVEAALGIVERDEPVVEAADAHVRVAVDRLDEGVDSDTEWIEWRLRPVETTVERTTVPTTRRGYAAVVEATVRASRIDAPGYDPARLRERLEFLEEVVGATGAKRDRRAFERIDDLVDWRE